MRMPSLKNTYRDVPASPGRQKIYHRVIAEDKCGYITQKELEKIGQRMDIVRDMFEENLLSVDRHGFLTPHRGESWQSTLDALLVAEHARGISRTCTPSVEGQSFTYSITDDPHTSAAAEQFTLKDIKEIVSKFGGPTTTYAKKHDGI